MQFVSTHCCARAVDQDFANSLTIATEFKCDNVGRFAYPGSCEKYYFCWNIGGFYAIFICPHKKAFDPVTRHCVYNFAVCAGAQKCKFNKHILPNSNDNSTFFVCKFRYLSNKFVLRKQDCAAGREFDVEFGYCKSKFLDDDISSDSSDSFEHVECEKPGVFIDYHSNDSKYFECIVKSVSKGTFKLIRHKYSDHMFNTGENNGVLLQCTCFELQLLSFVLYIVSY